MKRPCWAIVALIAVTGASPPRSLPVPPVPPAHPPAGQVAPVPNPDLRPPADPADQGLQVRLQDFRARRFDEGGMGYSPGSQYETTEDKRPIQTPGLTVRVPLQ